MSDCQLCLGPLLLLQDLYPFQTPRCQVCQILLIRFICLNLLLLLLLLLIQSALQCRLHDARCQICVSHVLETMQQHSRKGT